MEKNNKISGYTLLETVISLMILTSVIVPCIAFFYRSTVLTDVYRELEAAWLIEQEAAVIRTFPGEFLPVRRRYIEGKEWTIRSARTGGNVVTYRISAEHNGKIKAAAIFYGRSE